MTFIAFVHACRGFSGILNEAHDLPLGGLRQLHQNYAGFTQLCSAAQNFGI
jgi:hypothetical protein